MTISSQTRRAGPFTGTGSTSEFPFSFKVFAAADLLVVEADDGGVETTLVLNSDYTVTLNPAQNTTPGGTVTLSSPLADGHTMIITSAVEALQPANLTNQGGFYPTVINDALDRATILIQQQQEALDRAAKLPITSPTDADALVANIMLLADEMPTLETVANNIGDVSAVADNEDNIDTVAGNITNVNAVGADITDVIVVATDIADVSAVAADIADVNTVAGVIGGVVTVAANIDDVVAVGNDIANVNAVAADLTNIDTVAGDIANVNAVGADIANVNTVAGDMAGVLAVVANETNINAVAADIAVVAAVGADIANVNTVAENIANVNTVAENIVDVTNFAGVYYGPSATDPATRRDGSALVDGDLYFNTANGDLRNYNGSGWQTASRNTGNYLVERFSGDAAETEFTLSEAPPDENSTQVYISGVYQSKATYSLAGDVLSFSEAPPAGTDNIEVVTITSLAMGKTTAPQVSYADQTGLPISIDDALISRMPTVPGMAAMRDFNAPRAARVWLSYHTTDGDGGHGPFRYVSGGSPGDYVDNNGTIIVPTGGDGSAAWLRDVDGPIQCAWFGLVENDVLTDNAPAIHKALAVAVQAASGSSGVGSLAVLPAGRFYHSGITVPEGCTLAGSSLEGTELAMMDGVDPVFNVKAERTRCQLRDLTVNGRRTTNTTGHGVDAWNSLEDPAHFLHLSNVHIHSCPEDGCRLQYANACLFEGVSITRCRVSLRVTRSINVNLLATDLEKFTECGMWIIGTLSSSVNVMWKGGFTETIVDTPDSGCPHVRIDGFRNNHTLSVEDVWLRGHATSLGVSVYGLEVLNPLGPRNVIFKNVVMGGFTQPAVYGSGTINQIDLRGVQIYEDTPAFSSRAGVLTPDSKEFDFYTEEIDLSVQATTSVFPLPSGLCRVQQVTEVVTTQYTGSGVCQLGTPANPSRVGSFPLVSGKTVGQINDVTSTLSADTDGLTTGGRFFSIRPNTPLSAGKARFRIRGWLY